MSGGRRPGAGRPAKTIAEHKRDRTYRPARHDRKPPVAVLRDKRGGANKKSLLRHVEDHTFRAGRHHRLLADDYSVFAAPNDGDEQRWIRLGRLASIQLYYLAAPDDIERAHAVWAYAQTATAEDDILSPMVGLLGEFGWVFDEATDEYCLTLQDSDPGAWGRCQPYPRWCSLEGLRVKLDEALLDAALDVYDDGEEER